MSHSTNYYDTLIEVAEDCPVAAAEIPTSRREGVTTIAMHQYGLLKEHPYHYTSDDLLFEVYAQKNDIPPANRVEERRRFFSKGQPCLRSSPLAKRHGWGIHSDAQGKIALYAVESAAYRQLAADPAIKHLQAFRSRRA